MSAAGVGLEPHGAALQGEAGARLDGPPASLGRGLPPGVAPAPGERTGAAPAPGTRTGAAPAAPRDTAAGADAVRLAAWVSIAAGAIHAIAAIDHFSHYWLYGAVFLVLTYGQVLWGMALLRGRVQRRGLAAALIANVAIVVLWGLTRTIGVPLGPEAGSTEPVGAMDIAVTVDELVLVAYLVAILRPDLRARRGLRLLLGAHRVRFGVMLCSASFFAALLGGHAH